MCTRYLVDMQWRAAMMADHDLCIALSMSRLVPMSVTVLLKSKWQWCLKCRTSTIMLYYFHSCYLFLVFTQAEYASRLHGGKDGWAQCKWHNRRRVLLTLSNLEHVPLSQTPSNWLIFMLTWSGTHINSNDSPPGNNQQEKRNHISPLMLPLFYTYTTQTYCWARR